MTKRQAKISRKVELMARRLKASHQSHRSFHFACIVEKGVIVASGYNSVSKTHPAAKKYGYKFYQDGLHAELAAVIKYGSIDLSNVELFVCRIDNNDVLAYSEPCKYCKKMLGMLKCKNYFYSIDSGWRGTNKKNEK